MSNNRDYYTNRGEEERRRASAATNPEATAAHLGMADRYEILADAQPNIRIVESSRDTSSGSCAEEMLGSAPDAGPSGGHAVVADGLDFTRKCDQELAFADTAPTQDTRVGHLEQALRYAQLAARGLPTIKETVASAAEPPRSETLPRSL
jgi:hypothetical protein